MKLQESLDKVKGHLENLEAQSLDRLDFEWEGILFRARSKKEANGGSIRLEAKLGRLFFTIEDAANRTMAIERINATNRGIDGAYRIGDKGIIHFSSVTETDEQLTGSALMSALTLILLEAETHLRALRAHLKHIPHDG